MGGNGLNILCIEILNCLPLPLEEGVGKVEKLLDFASFPHPLILFTVKGLLHHATFQFRSNFSSLKLRHWWHLSTRLHNLWHGNLLEHWDLTVWEGDGLL
jgi:hypothetical protein